MAEDKKLKIKKTDKGQKSLNIKKKVLPELNETPEPNTESKRLLIKNTDSSASVKSNQNSALKIKKPGDSSASLKSGQESALKIKKPGDSSASLKSGQESALKIKKTGDSSASLKSGQESALKIKKTGAPTPGQASQSQPKPIQNPLAKAPQPASQQPAGAPTPGQASQSQPRPIQNPLAKAPQPAPNTTAPAPAQPQLVQPPPVQPQLVQPQPVQPPAAQQQPPPMPTGYQMPTPQPAAQQQPPPMPTGYQMPTPQPAAQQPQAFPTGKQQPPPQPAGYTTPAQPSSPSVSSQGPVFPTQQNQFTPAPSPVPAQRTIYEQPASSQGPVFPTNAQDTSHLGTPPPGAPPGTLAPPTHGKSTSAPLSAIMGEVKAAKKINVIPQQAAEVVKIKKPVGGVKDTQGNEFCMIPKGQYYIGLDNDLEEVRAAFTISRFPVTKQQYFQFISEKNVDYSPEEFNEINKISPYPNCPAVMVSWHDAKAYCRWLRAKTGEYYALPSIKEWECAARGKDGRIYPWGEGEPTAEISCFNDQVLEPQTTSSVDFYQNNVSPFGCVGMIGNVMEWTLDSFDDERDPHILKGGSWMSTIDFCNNITPCMSYPPEKRQEFVGFRVLYLSKEMYKDYKQAHSS